MTSPQRYLVFANQADMYAETASDPAMRDHFVHMALRWRDLANDPKRAEADCPED
jgi:hypothetical protein